MTTSLDIPSKHIGVNPYNLPDLTDKSTLHYYGAMTVEQYINYHKQCMIDNLDIHYNELIQTYTNEYENTKTQLYEQLADYIQQQKLLESNHDMVTDDDNTNNNNNNHKPKKKTRGKK